MGITGAHELSHSVKGLSVQDVFIVCSYIRQQQNLELQPTIDIDASLIYRSSKLSIDNRMKQLVEICCQLSSIGFLVVLVCDGAVRHHTKRATVQRQSALFRSKVKSYLLRVKLMALAETKVHCITEAEKADYEKEENSLSNAIKGIEKQLQHLNIDVGQDFFVSLEKHIRNIPPVNLGKKMEK